REQHRDEPGDDGDDHEQFDQRESPPHDHLPRSRRYSTALPGAPSGPDEGKFRMLPTLATLAALSATYHALQPAPDGLKVRDGYRVEVAIADLPGARFLEFDDRGTLY